MKLPVRHRQEGLSLIELMIAITLSLLLILGVTQIFLSSKSTYASNQELSQIQESGRFAVQLLAWDIRNTGYRGQCLTAPVNHIDSGASVWVANDAPIQGWENSKPPFVSDSVVAGSDVIFVQFATGAGSVKGAAGNTYNSDEIALVDSISPVGPGLTLISDGLACDLFNNTADAGAAVVAKNSSTDWSHNYTDEFEVLTFRNVAYYIAEQDGVPTLHRVLLDQGLNELGGADEKPLVRGVTSMNIEYGIANNRIVNSYVDASSVTNWANVASVRINLEVTADSGMKRDFSTTIALRNLLP